MAVKFDVSDGWYFAQRLGEGITRISEMGGNNLYLIEGGERALVFDTGHGAGALEEFLTKLTQLPLLGAMSHSHGDHAGGNDFFDTVYGGAEDIVGLTRENLAEKRENTRKNACFPEGYVLPRDIPVQKGTGKQPKALHGCPAREQTLAVRDGQTLELGGRVVRFLETPGHSPGSICLLDEKSGALFTGDTYVPHEYWGPMWLHIWNCPELSVYYRSLCRLKDVGAKWLLSGHGECGFLPGEWLPPYVELVRAILSGERVGEPLETFIGEGLFICEGASSIVYDPTKLGVI